MNDVLEKRLEKLVGTAGEMISNNAFLHDLFEQILVFKEWCDAGGLPDNMPNEMWLDLFNGDWLADDPFTKEDVENFVASFENTTSQSVDKIVPKKEDN